MAISTSPIKQEQGEMVDMNRRFPGSDFTSGLFWSLYSTRQHKGMISPIAAELCAERGEEAFAREQDRDKRNNTV